MGSNFTDPIDEREHKLEVAGLVFCRPLSLLIDYSVFMYLVLLYRHRKTDWLVKLLFVLSFIGFVVQFPFGYAEDGGEIRNNLQDVSEGCAVMTFILRILIVNRDVTKTLRPNLTMKILSTAARCTAVLYLLDLIANFLQIVIQTEDVVYPEWISEFLELGGIIIISISRFYFLSLLSNGSTMIIKQRKFESLWYLLLITHEMPFWLLNDLTGLDWESVQGTWMRICLAMIIGLSASKSGRIFPISSQTGAGTMSKSFKRPVSVSGRQSVSGGGPSISIGGPGRKSDTRT